MYFFIQYIIFIVQNENRRKGAELLKRSILFISNSK